jgi:hypothetical protein
MIQMAAQNQQMNMNTGGSKVPFYQGMIGFGQHHMGNPPLLNQKANS